MISKGQLGVIKQVSEFGRIVGKRHFMGNSWIEDQDKEALKQDRFGDKYISGIWLYRRKHGGLLGGSIR